MNSHKLLVKQKKREEHAKAVEIVRKATQVALQGRK